ncbi:YqzK family protein [Virgibacillus doumboii]|uniref:YqzK family protein n=1 Tax=Virgibacillus doumboii TaxID=2697503 RepID=UPI0013DFFD64|nr:YqzK family protein [Virgibacillus doumboii]
MKNLIWDTVKVFVIFVACTALFYFGLRAMHAEYEQFHRYDPPEGPSVKVFNPEESFFDRLNLFFRLGE